MIAKSIENFNQEIPKLLKDTIEFADLPSLDNQISVNLTQPLVSRVDEINYYNCEQAFLTLHKK